MSKHPEFQKMVKLEQSATLQFQGFSPPRPSRVFGGQVLAQALAAAQGTVDPAFVAHSMHGYFLRPGNPAQPIIYDVEAIREGRSFATRRVVASQNDKAIFNSSVSLQLEEDGLSHHAEMPTVPPPDELQPDVEYWAKLHREHPDRFGHPFDMPLERYSVNMRDYVNPQVEEPRQQAWLRFTGDIDDSLTSHQVVLALISDFFLLGTALRPHPITSYDPRVQAASLDHAIWFHRPFRVDDYLLYDMDSPSAAGGRGLSRGQFFSKDGTLVASTTQESLQRLRK